MNQTRFETLNHVDPIFKSSRFSQLNFSKTQKQVFFDVYTTEVEYDDGRIIPLEGVTETNEEFMSIRQSKIDVGTVRDYFSRNEIMF